MKDFATVTLDVCYEDTLFDAILAMTEGLPIVPTIVREHGSAAGAGGNGWPEVQFAGAADDIMTMLIRYCGGDLEQALDHFEDVETTDRALWGGQFVF